MQRQYTGSAGKMANCQIGASLSIAEPQDHVPIDFELYLPECWANDPARRAAGKIPDKVGFKTKPQLALDMLRRAVNADLPRGTVLADEGPRQLVRIPDRLSQGRPRLRGLGQRDHTSLARRRARFAFFRVVPAADDGREPRRRDPHQLDEAA